MIPYWLVADFFSFLWWLSEEGEKVEMRDKLVEVIVDDSISFKADSGSYRSTYKGQILSDAKRSFGLGKQIDAMTAVIKVEDRLYEFRFAKGGLRSYKVLLPLTSASSDGQEAALHENLLLIEEADQILDLLLRDYLERRTTRSEELLDQIRTLEVTG